MKKLKNFFTSSVSARIITSILLIIALSNQQIGYYKFLRWTVFTVSIYTVFVSYIKKRQMNFGVWLFGLIAVLFNPIIPFYLGKYTWQKVDIIVAAILIISTFILKEEKTK